MTSQPTDITTTAPASMEKPKEKALAALLRNENVLERFEQAAGAQAGSLIVSVINAANANPEIWECEPTSVITSALNAAVMKLSIAPAAGEAAIVPFNENRREGDEWKTIKKAQLMVMVKGISRLALRTNKYRVLNSFPVYDGQSIEEDQMTGRKVIAGKAVSKNVIGYGAYFLYFSGYEHCVYWPIEKILEHAQKFSKSFDKSKGEFNKKSAWATNLDAMCRKTVLRDLIINHGEMDTTARQVLERIEAENSDPEAEREIIDATMSDVPAIPAKAPVNVSKTIDDLYG